MPTKVEQAMFDAMEATWPAAKVLRVHGWVLRQGLGGGKRVSAATATALNPEISSAEKAMSELGQASLFMITPDDTELDGLLEQQGYSIVDPVTIYSASNEDLIAKDLPATAAIPAWPPLRAMLDIWKDGGIGPERVAIMDRVQSAKTGIVSRNANSATGTAFVAIDQKIAMIHAIEVHTDYRGQGHGQHLLQRAAAWAHGNGATQLALAVTKANTAANGLYQSLGMEPVTAYHYRLKTK